LIRNQQLSLGGLNLFIIPEQRLRDIRLSDSDSDDFDPWSPLIAVVLERLSELLIETVEIVDEDLL